MGRQRQRAGVELSNTTWGKITLTELVVHGWDIAIAIGHPFDLPEHTLQACFDHVAVFVPNAPLPDLWGPPVEVPQDAALLVASWPSLGVPHKA